MFHWNLVSRRRCIQDETRLKVSMSERATKLRCKWHVARNHPGDTCPRSSLRHNNQSANMQTGCAEPECQNASWTRVLRDLAYGTPACSSASCASFTVHLSMPAAHAQIPLLPLDMIRACWQCSGTVAQSLKPSQHRHIGTAVARSHNRSSLLSTEQYDSRKSRRRNTYHLSGPRSLF